MQPSLLSNITLDEKHNGCDKSKMGTIGSKMSRKFEQKRTAKWDKEDMPRSYLITTACMCVCVW